jgi:hypothetical protein
MRASSFIRHYFFTLECALHHLLHIIYWSRMCSSLFMTSESVFQNTCFIIPECTQNETIFCLHVYVSCELDGHWYGSECQIALALSMNCLGNPHRSTFSISILINTSTQKWLCCQMMLGAFTAKKSSNWECIHILLYTRLHINDAGIAYALVRRY